MLMKILMKNEQKVVLKFLELSEIFQVGINHV